MKSLLLGGFIAAFFLSSPACAVEMFVYRLVVSGPNGALHFWGNPYEDLTPDECFAKLEKLHLRPKTTATCVTNVAIRELS